MYGQRLMDFEPYTGSFKCGHPILAVLASGDVVPCCHMSSPFLLLEMQKQTKFQITDKNKSLICNIRTKKEENLKFVKSASEKKLNEQL